MAEKNATKRHVDGNSVDSVKSTEVEKKRKKILMATDYAAGSDDLISFNMGPTTRSRRLASWLETNPIETWECTACSFVNCGGFGFCSICQTPSNATGTLTSKPKKKAELNQDSVHSTISEAAASAQISQSDGVSHNTEAQDQNRSVLIDKSKSFNEFRTHIWTCPECTFINSNESEYCEMCQTPKNLVELLRFELDQAHSLISELKQLLSSKGDEDDESKCQIYETIKYPDNWSVLNDNQDLNLVPLTHGQPEYQFVIDTGGANLRGLLANITSIQRIENWGMYQVYAQRRETMAKKNGANVTNEHWLWHGSDIPAVDSICRYGFNRSYAGKNGTLLGFGVYFATDISTSLKFALVNPTKTSRAVTFHKVLLCRVLTGQFVVGAPTFKEAPLTPSGARYDSVVDKMDAPIMFAVFQDYQAYPEYVITLRF